MGNRTLIYKEKFQSNLKESRIHLKRLNDAFVEIEKGYSFPLNNEDFNKLLENVQNLAFADQIIYRFSKLQDIMGAKLFKSYLLFQGENTDKPFLDILNQLEKLNILEVDKWFEFRDIRNEIAHNYEEDGDVAVNILNIIYTIKGELKIILDTIQQSNY